MPVMTVQDFSSLKNITFTLSPINIVIGAQGSGKSITAKLFYFCADVPNIFINSAERGDTLEEFKATVAKNFCLWFPPSAWGDKKFTISYQASVFALRILRRRRGDKFIDDVAVTFSDWFDNLYNWSRTEFEKISTSTDDRRDSSSTLLDRFWRLQDVIMVRKLGELGTEHISTQTFIPAGRAFFTSIGRLVAGFEQAGSLDPVTIKFARLFAGLRDRNSSRFGSSRFRQVQSEYLDRRRKFMATLFGGEIKFERDREFVEMPDGRKIPFNSLSSGQQELLPMWSIIDYFGEIDARKSGYRTRKNQELIYIEEPEAHLFPYAQSQLMEFLIGSVSANNSSRSLIITTHSPYVIGKINVFLKASQLSRRKKKNSEINEIVPRECWIPKGGISVSALEDGVLRQILDKKIGLVDASYLDSVSETISREFSKLLQIEMEM